MLSILIPTYNYVCAHLVCELHKQCEEVQALLGRNFAYEIIVADDCSTDSRTIEKNGVIDFLTNCRYETLDENIGRARIRNWLINHACYEWCLLIDSDAEILHDNFILEYLSYIEKADIIIGGIHTSNLPREGCELRHRYELAAFNQRNVEIRQAHPEANFSTFNVLINKRVFEIVQFDERCSQYGYEDALFGIQANDCGFQIFHIDNPLQHNGINDNASFLANSESALRNLHRLGEPMISHARVSRTAKRLSWLKWPIIALYRLLRPSLRHNLLSHHPNLHLFSFYKLGYYLSL